MVEKTLFLTGATGYIGGRLAPLLLEKGYRLKCLCRSREKLMARPWASHPQVEVLEGDASCFEDVLRAMQGCEAAYYLIHSMMTEGKAFRHRDKDIAQIFGRAAKEAGVSRIVYLGGLGETGRDLSEHLVSRREVESALKDSGVPVTTFRAAMIIGSGSASFEILRYLVERLPVMITPKWVRTECQPIAVRNVLHYLVECLACPETLGHEFDIGGPDVLTYRELMRIMAEVRGLPRRWIFPVPVLTPRLSSLWIHLVTPVDAKIARPLAEGLRNRVTCRDSRAADLMPQKLLDVREAFSAAFGKNLSNGVPTSWTDAGTIPGDPDWSGGTVLSDRREIHIPTNTQDAFAAVCRIGGGNGYYKADWLWRIRGALDKMLGGPGLRRGRKNRESVRYGEALDFWRVVKSEPGRRLTLRAEMKLPGEAVLDFEIRPSHHKKGGCDLVQSAMFRPKGLFGLAYWYATLPLHHFVFKGMLEGIRDMAIEIHNREDRQPPEEEPDSKPDPMSSPGEPSIGPIPESGR